MDIYPLTALALPMPALIPGEIKGLAKPAEFPTANHLSPATTGLWKSQGCSHKVSPFAVVPRE
jgi:hypothetical protein